MMTNRDTMSKYLTLNRNTRYIRIKDWSKYHPWPSPRGLRRLIWEKNQNGFDKVMVKVGKIVLIDERAFFEWMEDQKKKNRGEKE